MNMFILVSACVLNHMDEPQILENDLETIGHKNRKSTLRRLGESRSGWIEKSRIGSYISYY